MYSNISRATGLFTDIVLVHSTVRTANLDAEVFGEIDKMDAKLERRSESNR